MCKRFGTVSYSPHVVAARTMADTPAEDAGYEDRTEAAAADVQTAQSKRKKKHKKRRGNGPAAEGDEDSADAADRREVRLRPVRKLRNRFYATDDGSRFDAHMERTAQGSVWEANCVPASGLS